MQEGRASFSSVCGPVICEQSPVLFTPHFFLKRKLPSALTPLKISDGTLQDEDSRNERIQEQDLLLFLRYCQCRNGYIFIFSTFGFRPLNSMHS